MLIQEQCVEQNWCVQMLIVGSCFSYNAMDSDEMSFSAGDVLDLEEEGEWWWRDEVMECFWQTNQSMECMIAKWCVEGGGSTAWKINVTD